MPLQIAIEMTKMKTHIGMTVLLLLVGAFALPSPANAADDLLLADFEGTNYGDWKVTGEAFGPGPAHGTLPGQMRVEGYQGKGLVNSFYGGDQSTGTLTSPPFKVARKFIRFLIGGGRDTEKTCMNLLIDGAIVRNATGPNDKPGGSEALAIGVWDVGEFAGKTATIQIVDSLRAKTHTIPPQPLNPGENPLAAVKGELLDLTAELAPGDAAEVGFNLRGVTVRYDAKKQELSCQDKKAALKPVDGKIRLRLLVDRTSIDIFGNDGRLYMPMGVIAPPDNLALEIYTQGGSARIGALEVHELKSAWSSR